MYESDLLSLFLENGIVFEPEKHWNIYLSSNDPRKLVFIAYNCYFYGIHSFRRIVGALTHNKNLKCKIIIYSVTTLKNQRWVQKCAQNMRILHICIVRSMLVQSWT